MFRHRGDKPCEDLLAIVTGPVGRWQWYCVLLFSLILTTAGVNLILFYYIAPPGIEYLCVSTALEDDQCESTGIDCTSLDYPNEEDDCEPSDPESCTAWKYSNEMGSNIIEKWNLVCKNGNFLIIYRIVEHLSVVFGFFVIGSLADWYGRKRILLISMIVQSVFGLILAFLEVLAMLIMVRCIYAFTFGGVEVIGLIYVCENTGIKHRSFMMSILVIFFGLGLMLIPFTNYLNVESLSYQTFTYIVSICQLFLTLIILWLEESPAWLLATQNTNQAQKSIKHIAKINKLELPQSFHIRMLHLTNSDSPVIENHIPVCQLLKKWSTARIIIALWLIWFLNSMLWMLGLWMITEKIDVEGNGINFKILLFATFSTTGFILYSFLLKSTFKYFKRHRNIIQLCSIISSAFLSGILIFYYLEIPSKVLIPICFVSIFHNAVAHAALWNYTPRIFPTRLRCTCTAIIFANGFLGIMAGIWLIPMTVQIFSNDLSKLWDINPDDLITAIIVLFCGILIYSLAKLLPKVDGRELPDKVKDTVRFQKTFKPQRWAALRLSTPTIEETEVKNIDILNVTEKRTSGESISGQPRNSILNKFKSKLRRHKEPEPYWFRATISTATASVPFYNPSDSLFSVIKQRESKESLKKESNFQPLMSTYSFQ